MCNLTSGRSEPCLTVGGVKRIYLFKYVDYAETLIVGVKGSTLTSFPATDIYSYECVNTTFDETINTQDDGISVDQTLQFTLIKQELLTTNRISDLKDIDLRYIVEFNNGDLRIGGLFKGAEVEEIKIVSGGAKGDLNGYQIKLKSTEEYTAPFISNLASVGFTSISWLMLENGIELLLEGNEQFILE